MGEVDAAEQYAATSVRTWGPGDRRDSVLGRVTLAATHAVAGDSDAPRLAATAIDAVSELRSVRGRAMLAPLEQALAGRKGETYAELAQRARTLRVG
jgi:hypothetical protein